MDTKRKNESKNAKMQSAISYKEVDFYRDKFAEWLTEKAGKEARSAFFALWAIEIFSRFDVSAFDEEVARARQALRKFLQHSYKPDN
jgi:hypothetical protein